VSREETEERTEASLFTPGETHTKDHLQQR